MLTYLPTITFRMFIDEIPVFLPRPAKFILAATAFVMTLRIMRRVVSATSFPPIAPR